MEFRYWRFFGGWSFVIGGFFGVEFRYWRFFGGWSFVIGGFLQSESSVGGVAGGRCSLQGPEVAALWRLLIHGVNGSANPFQQLWPCQVALQRPVVQRFHCIQC